MFSIITPSYNRKDTLYRVYESLQSQTFRDFHWVIVDDASSDNTEQLVNSWITEEKNFNIQYHKLLENKGKPFALNFGLPFCTEPITIIADSDDSFESNTLNDLKELWDCVNNSLNGDKICTIWTLVKDEEGNIVGDKFPKNFWQVGLKERVLQRKQPVAGEKWHSWRTEVLKKYGMFHNDNTIQIGESATWVKINQDYDFLCVNLVHRIYWHSEDGLIQKKRDVLKTAKIKYYTSYYQLNETPSLQILKYRYYRILAFNYLKSNLHFKDKKEQLGFSKKFACIIGSLLELPNRIFAKI